MNITNTFLFRQTHTSAKCFIIHTKHQIILTVALVCLGLLAITYACIRSKNRSQYKDPLPKSFIPYEVRRREQNNREKNAQEICLLAAQPNNILFLIWGILDMKSWCALSRVKKEFNEISKSPFIINKLLENRDLFTEQFVDPLPTEIYLKYLQIAKNAVTALTPPSNITDEELQQTFLLCPKIQKLELVFCKKLTNSGFKNFPKDLQSLSFPSSMHLTEEAVSYLPKLTSIQLSGDHTKTVLDRICSISTLTDLHLISCTNLKRESIQKLSNNLLSLELLCCNLTQIRLEDLPNSLLKLDIADGELFEPQSFRHLSHLKSLTLKYCKNITNTHLEDLPPNLETLWFRGTDTTDFGLTRLPRTITRLHLSDTYITDDTLKDLPFNIEKLFLSKCENLTDAILIQFFMTHPALKELSICSCDEITDAIIPYLPTTLTKLDFDFCTQISGVSFDRLNDNLSDLSVRGCSAGNAAINQLTHLINLKHLDLSYCNLITGEGLYQLPPNLLSLDLSDNFVEVDPLLTSQSFTGEFFDRLPGKLSSLRLNGLTFSSKMPFDQLPIHLAKLFIYRSTFTHESYESLIEFNEKRGSIHILGFDSIYFSNE